MTTAGIILVVIIGTFCFIGAAFTIAIIVSDYMLTFRAAKPKSEATILDLSKYLNHMCDEGCGNCSLSENGISCSDLIRMYPEKANEIVLKWLSKAESEKEARK